MNVEIITKTGSSLKSKPLIRNVDLKRFWFEYLSIININANTLNHSEVEVLSELLSFGKEGSVIRRGVLKKIADSLKMKPSFVTAVKNSLIEKGFLDKEGKYYKPMKKLYILQDVLDSKQVSQVNLELSYILTEDEHSG